MARVMARVIAVMSTWIFFSHYFERYKMGTDESVNAPFAYDLFLSCVNADHAWVEGYLIPALEIQTRLIPLLKAKCKLPLRIDLRVRLHCADPAHWERKVERSPLFAGARPGARQSCQE